MSVSSVTGPAAGEPVKINTRPGASAAEIRHEADKVFLQQQMNSANLFFQQLPGNCSPGGLVGELMEKAKSAGNDSDPAAADLDTGIQ